MALAVVKAAGTLASIPVRILEPQPDSAEHMATLLMSLLSISGMAALLEREGMVETVAGACAAVGAAWARWRCARCRRARHACSQGWRCHQCVAIPYGSAWAIATAACTGRCCCCVSAKAPGAGGGLLPTTHTRRPAPQALGRVLETRGSPAVSFERDQVLAMLQAVGELASMCPRWKGAAGWLAPCVRGPKVDRRRASSTCMQLLVLCPGLYTGF